MERPVLTYPEKSPSKVLSHPWAKWIAENRRLGWIAAAVTLAQWDEYAFALACYWSFWVAYGLKTYHWNTEKKYLKYLCWIGCIIAMLVGWPITLAKKGDKPWSDTWAKLIAPHTAPALVTPFVAPSGSPQIPLNTDRHPKKSSSASVSLPNAYIQSFDGGPCPGGRSVLDSSHGVFSELENATTSCQTVNRLAVELMAHNLSAARITGITPKGFSGQTMMFTMRWWTGDSHQSLINTGVEIRFLRSCGGHNMVAAGGGTLFLKDTRVLDSFTKRDIPACKSGEQDSYMILRNGEKDTVSASIYLISADMDFR